MKEKPGPAITCALRKQNILHEAQPQSRPPAKLCRTGRLPRNRTWLHLLRPAEEAVGCHIQGRAAALSSVRREAYIWAHPSTARWRDS